jgi:tetratricopeptide (TPR) repeat protein
VGVIVTSEPKVRDVFDNEVLAALGDEAETDVHRVESLFGVAIAGPLRSLLSRRGGDHQLELGAWMVHSDTDAYPRDTKRFATVPFEVALGESWWLHGLFADAIPIGRDGSGQVYYARLHQPHEVSLYDPGQDAVRFIASDLPTFAYLASLGQRAERLVEELELDDPEDADPDAPEFQELRRDLLRIADRINLTDDVVATDFDEILIALTGLHPNHRPESSPTERLHDRADWLSSVLSMGYDSVPLEGIPDTYDEDRRDPEQWSSPATRLYWLWRSFVLDETARLDELVDALDDDQALLVRDSVRLARQLRDLDGPDAAPEGLRDVVRSRISLSALWQVPPTALALPKATSLPSEHLNRLSFLGSEGYCRGSSAFVEEARECVAALRHSGRAIFMPLVAHLDRPPAGGQFHPEYNPVGATLLPYDADSEAKATLIEALEFRSRDLSHLRLLPGVVRALGRLGADDCVPKLLALLDEFAVAWAGGYAKAGDVGIVEAVCDSLAMLDADDAVDRLVALANHDLEFSGGFGVRARAIVALAHTQWSPPAEQVHAWLQRDERSAALYVMALRGDAVELDPELTITPATCFASMCAAKAAGDLAGGVAAAEVALQTLNTDPFDTGLAHRVALELVEQALPYEEASVILERFVQFARLEDVRDTALRLVRRHDPEFTVTFCDRATVDVAFANQGEAGLVGLLTSPHPVFLHNVFGKAAEVGAIAAVAEHLMPFARGLSQYLYRWPRSLPYLFETQYYAEVSRLQAVGEPTVTDALDALWKSGTVGRERVEYVVGNLSYEGVGGFEATLSQRRDLEAKVNAAYAAGRYDDAAKLGSELLRECPTSAAALRNLGHAQIMAGELDAALEAYLQATTIEPGHAMGWYWVSQASYRKEQWSDVIRYARQGLAVDADCLRCRFNLGLGLHLAGRIDEAISAYERLATEDLSHEDWMIADLHLNFAVVLAQQGQLDRAQGALRIALAKNRAYLEIALASDELVEALGEAVIAACAEA